MPKDKFKLTCRTVAALIVNCPTVTVREVVNKSVYLTQRQAKTQLDHLVDLKWLTRQRVLNVWHYRPTICGLASFPGYGLDDA